jgi:acyl dehydratase
MNVQPSVRREVAIGDELPSFEVSVTATRIVAGAIASMDFMPAHHDRAYANSQGAPDIFMNIMSTNAWCSRFLTDWGGPDTMIHRLSIRLGVPVYPGALLTLTGKVTGRTEAHDLVWFDIDLRATTELGGHASGSARVSLPKGADRWQDDGDHYSGPTA